LAKGTLRLRPERCKGCGLCVAVCNFNLLRLADELNLLGYHPVVFDDERRCTGCALCAWMCPDQVIDVVKGA